MSLLGNNIKSIPPRVCITIGECTSILGMVGWDVTQPGSSCCATPTHTPIRRFTRYEDVKLSLGLHHHRRGNACT